MYTHRYMLARERDREREKRRVLSIYLFKKMIVPGTAGRTVFVASTGGPSRRRCAVWGPSIQIERKRQEKKRSGPKKIYLYEMEFWLFLQINAHRHVRV